MEKTEQQEDLIDTLVQQFRDRFHVDDLEFDYFAVLIEKGIELSEEGSFVAQLFQVILDNDDALLDLYCQHQDSVVNEIMNIVTNHYCNVLTDIKD